MGNDESRELTDEKPQTLETKDIKGVARYIESEDCQNIYVMAGAGISTSAGIPDFRSPGTGLYHNLQKLNLPRAEAVFDIEYFRHNPVPFYILAKDMNPEQFRPTITHSFFRLLHEKGRLAMCFTQNIDTLERRAGLPEHKIIEAHGSFAASSCIECKSVYPHEKMRHAVETGEIAHCERCGGLVKPDIVFFGEGLPASFFKTAPRLADADLLLIFGTSLTVMPFAGLCRLVPSTCPRILINLDEAGDIGSRSDDVLALGKCDDLVRELCDELGWLDELESMWAETEWMDQRPKPAVEKKEAGPAETAVEEKVAEITNHLEEKLALEEAVKEVVEEKAEKGELVPEAGPGISKVVEEGAAVPTKDEPPKEEVLRTATHEEAHPAESSATESQAAKEASDHANLPVPSKPLVSRVIDALPDAIVASAPVLDPGASEAKTAEAPSTSQHPADEVSKSSLF